MQLTRPLLFRILVTTKSSSLLFLLFHALPFTRSTDRRWKMVSKATTELTVFDKLACCPILFWMWIEDESKMNVFWMEYKLLFEERSYLLYRMSRKLLGPIGWEVNSVRKNNNFFLRTNQAWTFFAYKLANWLIGYVWK